MKQPITMHTRKDAISLKELATAYGINEKVFKRWILPHYNQIGPKIGRYYTPAQVKVIFSVLGIPSAYDE